MVAWFVYPLLPPHSNSNVPGFCKRHHFFSKKLFMTFLLEKGTPQRDVVCFGALRESNKKAMTKIGVKRKAKEPRFGACQRILAMARARARRCPP